MKKIGFIGIGTMGLPMASNIINKGYSLSFYDPFVNSESVNTLRKTRRYSKIKFIRIISRC